MGSNYVPIDYFITRAKLNNYETLLDSIVDANHNMIRVWGGGYYENDEFYSLCDKKGILVFQDFMFACEMYPGTPDFMDNIRQEVIEQVKRLNPHPSVALWNGNNEVSNAWKDWGLQVGINEKNKEILWNWYQDIFEKLIPEIIWQYDPNKFYWPTSPQYGFGHRESVYFGDSHYWGVWAGRDDIFFYDSRGARFMSEYGMQGLPSMSTFMRFTNPADRNLNSSVINFHQRHHSGRN
jgi:beta-mannosidase